MFASVQMRKKLNFTKQVSSSFKEYFFLSLFSPFFAPGSGFVILHDCDGLCMASTLTMIQKLTVR